MSPRSRSRSVTPRRSYSRSPYRRSGRRKSYSRYKYDSRSSSNSRHPPSPPPLTTGKHSGRYSSDSRSTSRSISPTYKKRHHNSRRHYSRSRSRTKSRSRSRSRSYDRPNRSNREKPLPSSCIGVFGLSVYTTQLKIREIFSKFGPIKRIHVVIDAQTGRSRGFCFIYYENLEDAKAACDNCCGMEIDGRRIRVAYSITERPHTPTPGVYMGRPAKDLRESYRAQQQQLKQRHHSPVSYSKSHRHHYERSRSRSYSPRRYGYRYH